MAAGDRGSGIGLADLVAAFSLATDLGLGQSMEHVLRAWLVASRLGERVGLDDDQRGALFYVATLAWVGCVADTPEVAAWFGDDIAFRRDSFAVDTTPLAMMPFLLRHAGAGGPPLHRLGRGAAIVATGGAPVTRGLQSHCVTAAHMAERLGLGEDVARPLRQFFTRWDGKGVPREVGGDEIALPMRLFHLADRAEVYHRTDGVEAAVAMARARRGAHFDPSVVDAFCPAAPELLDPGPAPDWPELVGGDPALARPLTEDALDAALTAFGDFTDLRSPSRAGHSRGVADLAAAAAAGLAPGDVAAVRRAAYLHDVGLHGVPATILDKPGPLTVAERERLRLHAYYASRVLARPPALARIGALAAMTHERGDGSGAPRGLTAAAIPVPARVLAAACAYRAMTEPRPYRPPLTAAQIKDELRADVRAGRLDAAAVDAVLAAAGVPAPRRRAGVAGLTPRELEVLALIARGASTRHVARRLGIAPKTAETHIERIYAKTGASTRATATLFAVRHGLLDPLDP